MVLDDAGQNGENLDCHVAEVGDERDLKLLFLLDCFGLVRGVGGWDA